MVNSSGQLIGVNSAKMASKISEGMGFAIPVDDVVEICDRIISKRTLLWVMGGGNIHPI